ncbi:hypothetical protein F2Q68_00021539 [Brassica cretica]|uniref:Uncharacterized protein n=2 Tax=Brassica cretica TaxID=69181 RepID=A0ABQ7CRP7_BRACR|nr:hypothetical protein F2Q68_00021539 [Brassica cretica]KAF3561993.1 hypothetical protein DY000_02019846 [Brassica cretica]
MNLSHQARFYVFQIRVGVRRYQSRSCSLTGDVSALLLLINNHRSKLLAPRGLNWKEESMPPKIEPAVERYLDRLRSNQSIEDDVVEERIDGIKHELLTRTFLVRGDFCAFGPDMDKPRHRTPERSPLRRRLNETERLA